MTQAAGILRGEQEVLREEIYHIRHTKDKYTDSDKVSVKAESLPRLLKYFATKFISCVYTSHRLFKLGAIPDPHRLVVLKQYVPFVRERPLKCVSKIQFSPS